MKKLFSLLLTAMMFVVGGGSAWAEDVYEEVSSKSLSQWTNDDVTDWGNNSNLTVDATHGLGFDCNLSGGVNAAASKSFTITNNAKVKYEVEWYYGSSLANAGNYSYLQFGDKIRLGWYGGGYRMNLSVDGGASYSVTSGIQAGSNTTYTTKITIIFNTQTKRVESFEFGNTDITSYVSSVVSTSFNTISFGFTRGGRGGNWNVPCRIANYTVSEMKQSAASADYTINYKFEENIIKTDNGNTVVGETVNAESPITIEGQKYYATSSTSMTITDNAANNVLNVTLRKANTYTYSVKNNFGEVVCAPTEGVEGEIYAVAYPKYILRGTDLYLAETSTGEKSFSKYITLTENTVATVTYTKHLENIVYFSEAEDVEGATVYNSCSNTSTFASGDLAVFSNLAQLTTLTAGYYKIYARTLGRTDRYFDFYNGNGEDKVSLFHPGCAGFYNCGEQVSSVIILNNSTDIYFQGGYGTTSNNGNVVDLFYIQKIGDALTAGTDATFLITNPNIDGNANGWTTEKRSGGNGPLKDNAVMEYWAGNATNRDEAGFDYYQTINNLPNGYYAVSAEMYNSLNGEAGAEFNQSCGVYGNGDIAYVTVEGNTLNRYTVITNVTNGTLRLGVKSDKRMGARWFVADNFRLTYFGDASATMTVNATAKYGTFCAPFAVTVPSGVEASIAAINANGTTIDLASVGEIIPANTPVILYAEDGLAATAVYGKAVAGTPTFGCLTGVYEDTQAPVGSYVLQMNDGVTGFYHVEDVQPTIGANRCYIPAPSVGARVRALYFGEKVTGINASAADDAVEAIYNANGIEVSAMQPGLNIVKMKSGKVQKVLVK